MKNLLLILLLANILYFLWGMFAPAEKERGVETVSEAKLGPPLNVERSPSSEAVENVGAALGSGAGSDFAAVVGRSCVTIGPFRDSNVADEAKTRYAAERMRTKLRSGIGEIFIGHWVQIRDIPSRDDSNRMLAELKKGGLGDAYPVETDDEGLKISLGLFGELDRAEKVELQARSLGFDADITPRMKEGTVFYVDIGLPPGRGAGEMIARYGEDQVLLRDKAKCPPTY